MSGETFVETFGIVGMSCGHCVAAVTEEVSRIDGVVAVHVDLEAGTATVHSDRKLDHSHVAAAVDEAGFEVAP